MGSAAEWGQWLETAAAQHREAHARLTRADTSREAAARGELEAAVALAAARAETLEEADRLVGEWLECEGAKRVYAAVFGKERTRLRREMLARRCEVFRRMYAQPTATRVGAKRAARELRLAQAAQELAGQVAAEQAQVQARSYVEGRMEIIVLDDAGGEAIRELHFDDLAAGPSRGKGAVRRRRRRRRRRRCGGRMSRTRVLHSSVACTCPFRNGPTRRGSISRRFLAVAPRRRRRRPRAPFGRTACCLTAAPPRRSSRGSSRSRPVGRSRPHRRRQSGGDELAGYAAHADGDEESQEDDGLVGATKLVISVRRLEGRSTEGRTRRRRRSPSCVGCTARGCSTKPSECRRAPSSASR